MNVGVVVMVGIGGVIVGMLAVWSWMPAKVAGLKAALTAKSGELEAERVRREDDRRANERQMAECKRANDAYAEAEKSRWRFVSPFESACESKIGFRKMVDRIMC